MPQGHSLLRYLLLGKAPVGTGIGSPAVTPLGRDARIDAVRGLALLVIFINHMPGNVVAGAMPHNFGFSDAADVFVLLAGISAVLAYGTLIERRGYVFSAVRIGARLWTLYIAHIAVFLIVCGVVARAVTGTHNPLYIEAINIQPFFHDTPAAVVDALTLTYQPYYLDILPLYIVLLGLFPLLYVLVRFSPALALAASAALWQGATKLDLNFPNSGAAGWFFNPFAWQFVFTLGVVIGRGALLQIAAPRSLPVDLLAVGILVFAAMVKLSSGNPFGLALLNDWIENLQIGIDKTNLAAIRVLHLIALAWLFIRFVPAGSPVVSGFVGRNLAIVGRHSLAVFCAGIVLAIAGQIILAETYFALWVQLLVCLSGITMLLGLGIFLSWYQSVAQQGSVNKQPAALGASASQS